MAMAARNKSDGRPRTNDGTPNKETNGSFYGHFTS